MKLKGGEKKVLAGITRKGRESARVINRARALELLGEGWTGEETAAAVGMSPSAIDYIKARYVHGNLEKALWDAPRSKRPEALNGKQKQQIVAMVCARVPEGRARWSVRLIASEAVARAIVPKVGRETIRLLLENHELKPWREKNMVHTGADVGIREPDGGSS